VTVTRTLEVRHLVQRRATAAATAVVLVLAALVTGAVTAHPAGATSVEDSFTARLNGARSDRGIPRLAVRSALAAVARAQAQRMANRGVLYHNPNLTRDVKNWRWVGENVGYGPNAHAVHVAFMKSAPHKANILDRDYSQIGIGAVVRGGRVWVAEVFRRPMHAASYASWSHTLRFGSKGMTVQRVQHRLGLRTTGWYGTATKRAVVSFQRRQGWAGHGNVGPRTWQRLF
jgi:uncharacterized protein YkwD